MLMLVIPHAAFALRLLYYYVRGMRPRPWAEAIQAYDEAIRLDVVHLLIFRYTLNHKTICHHLYNPSSPAPPSTRSDPDPRPVVSKVCDFAPHPPA
jgi:hypothetical protein